MMSNKRAIASLNYLALISCITGAVVISKPFVVGQVNAHLMMWQDAANDSLNDPVATSDPGGFTPPDVGPSVGELKSF